MIGISFSQYDKFIHLTSQWNVLNILLYYSLKKEECVRLFKPVGFFSVTGHIVCFVDTSIYVFHYYLYFLFIQSQKYINSSWIYIFPFLFSLCTSIFALFWRFGIFFKFSLLLGGTSYEQYMSPILIPKAI